MVALKRSLLIWSVWVTVKEKSSSATAGIEFNGGRIRKLTAVVRQTDLKNGRKSLRTKQIEKAVDVVRDRSGIIVIAKESEHEFTTGKMNGKQDLAALLAFNRVKLCNRNVRVKGHKVQKIRIIPTDAAGFFHLKRGRSFFARTKPDFSRKIEVHSRNSPGVNQPVNGTFADHKGIPTGGTDMMRRLPLSYQRRDDGVEAEEFVL